jgi:hypothetical protein
LAQTRTNYIRWSPILAVASLAMTAGCADQSDSRPRARDKAAEIVRADAREAQGDFSRILQEAAPDDDGPERAANQAGDEMGSRGQLIDVAVDNDGTVRAKVAFYAQGRTGRGLSKQTVTVRLCVTLQGIPVQSASAALLDIPCPTGALPSGRYLEKADETITLAS